MGKRAYVYDGTKWVDIAQTATDMTGYANIATTPISGFRNKIINGSFDIWQRGIGAFTTSNAYTADRWAIVAASGQTVSVSQQSFTVGNAISGYEPTYYSRITWSGTPSGTYWYTQRVEDVRTFAGQTVTLSFWAKASSASTALTPVIEQNFGSGGSSVVTTNGTSLSLTTSWQRFSQTFIIPSISGKTIGTNSYLDVRPFTGSTSVTGINFDIWGVQLEKGSIATPLEQRPQQIELALCQRYYQIALANQSGLFFDAYQAANGYNNVWIPTKVNLRTAVSPTYITTGGTWVNIIGSTFASVNPAIDGTWFSVRFTALGRGYFYLSDINWNAEL